MFRSASRRLALVPLVLVAYACEGKTTTTVPCSNEVAHDRVPVNGPLPVDLLIVVDDSPAMAGARAKLRDDLSFLVRSLLTGDTDMVVGPEWPPIKDLRIGFVTSDMGVQGIGTNGETPVIGCGADPLLPGGVDTERANHGDDAVLRRRQATQYVVPGDASSGIAIDCDQDGTPGDDVVALAELPAFLTFSLPPFSGPLAPDELDEATRRTSCLGNPGSGGCGFTQPLESMLKAITPGSETSGLPGGAFYAAAGETSRSLGRGDDPGSNAGWLRDDSLLAVLVVGAGDDCSAATPVVYDSSSTAAGYVDAYGAFQQATRCARHASDLRPIDRFVQGLIARRARRENLLYFGVVGGLPPALATGTNGESAFEQALADPTMQYAYEARDLPAGPGGSTVSVPDAAMSPTCSHVDPTTMTVDFSATPSRRLVEMAESLYQFGASTRVESLCDDGAFESIANDLLGLQGPFFQSPCLARPLTRNADNLVDCDLLVTLPPNTSCANTHGWNGSPPTMVTTTDAADTDGQLERCALRQLPVSAADRAIGNVSTWEFGWFYDDFTAAADACVREAGLVNVVERAALPNGSELDLSCSFPHIEPSLALDRGVSCDSPLSACSFASEADAAAFAAFYRLPSTFDPATDFVCEPNTITCQIACETDADCPTGDSCMSGDDPRIPRFCGNPACIP